MKLKSVLPFSEPLSDLELIRFDYHSFIKVPQEIARKLAIENGHQNGHQNIDTKENGHQSGMANAGEKLALSIASDYSMPPAQEQENFAKNC